MLAFERHLNGETDRVELLPKTLIVAGWIGRDERRCMLGTVTGGQ